MDRQQMHYITWYYNKKGTIVGTRSVVTKDTEEYSVVSGNPDVIKKIQIIL